ncbi:MAG: hypothetical protein LBD08_03330, partial [Treponema sp.]|nr:hypothetical protein [Treponema sp.]
VLLFAGMGLWAGEPPFSLSAMGGFPLEGTVSELKALHDIHGGVFVIFIADGRLGIYHGDKQGNFEPYQAEGLEEEELGEVRLLRLLDRGPRHFAAFISRTGGAETVYLLSLDHQGGLRAYPARETRSAERIADYALAYGAEGAALYLLSGGVLSGITGINGPWELPVKRRVSGEGERVAAFGFSENLSGKFGCGWYRAAGREGPEWSLFSSANHALFYRKKLGIYGPDARIGITAAADRIVFTVIDGKKAAVFEGSAEGFTAAAAFEAPVPVSGYYAAENNGGLGILTGGERGGAVYGVSGGTSAAPRFQRYFTVPDGLPVELADVSINAVSINTVSRDTDGSGGREFAALYQKEGRWRSVLLDADRGAGEETILPGIAEGAVKLPGRGGADRQGRLLYFISVPENAGQAEFIMLNFERDRWGAAQRLTLPGGTGKPDISAWTQKINGLLFLALHDGRRVLVCRMEGGAV